MKDHVKIFRVEILLWLKILEYNHESDKSPRLFVILTEL